MNYIAKSLTQDETIIFSTQLHWIVYKLPILLALFALAMTQFNDPKHVANVVIPIFSALLALLTIIPRAIARNTTEFAVTNRRLIVKRGFLSTRTIEMDLTKIESIDLIQPLMGRILDYGTIVVQGVGSTTDPIPKIAHPNQLRNAITSGQSRLLSTSSTR